MKQHLLCALMASMSLGLHAEITETATDAVRNMGIGWNLGNTLDANGAVNGSYWGCQGLESETYWGQPVTASPLFEMMRKAGFGAIRVPVTWYNHMDEQGNIDAAWMLRVHEVVNYVIDNGLYCIVNVHHDTGADGGSFKSWIKADMDIYSDVKQRYNRVWSQIAEEFKDYGDHLLFEAYNEMLDGKNSWCFATFNYPGQYNATDAAKAYQAINSYAQDFVNTVRQSGSNNATRNLVVNTYAASNGYGTWSTHLKEPLTEMTLPADQTPNHLIFEVHAYPQIAYSSGNRSLQDIKNEVNGMITGLKNNLVSKGAPVIFGEWGTTSPDGQIDYEERPELMKQFIAYFVQQTKANDMATFYWMGLSDGQYRSMPAFSQPDLAECMAKAYHGDDFVGEYPVPEKSQEVVCFDGDKVIGWGNGITIQSASFKSFDDQAVVVLTYKQEGADDDIQFFMGDWSQKASFIVDGQSFEGDLQPSTYYGTPVGTEHTTVFSFDAATYATVKSRGLIIHGNNIRLSKAVLRDASSAAISTVTLDAADEVIYNLSGQRVAQPTHGIYLKGGKKIIL